MANFAFDAKILGRGFAYDIRGKDGPRGNLTPEFAYRLGKVLGSRLPVGARYFITGDARISTNKFREELIRGLREVGINVVATPSYLPTGIASWYVVQQKFDGSTVVSGSHNPAGDNGFKITEHGKALYGKELASIEGPLARGQWRTDAPMGTLEVVDVAPSFMGMLSKVFSPYRHPYNILLDCGDGIGGGIREALEINGAQVFGMNLAPDGRFPTYGKANPSKPECYGALSRNVVSRNEGITDPGQRWIGMMLDGDGDRVILVSQTGRVFQPEKMAAIFYREYLRALKAGRLPAIYGPHLALDVRATSSTTRMVAAEGGIGFYIQAGYPAHREWADSLIPIIGKSKVTGTSAEASGHFFEPTAFYGPNGEEYPEFASALIDDGFFMGMRMMGILDGYGITLDELMDQIPSLPAADEMRIAIDNAQKFEVMDQMPDIFRRTFGSGLKPQTSAVINFGNLRIQHPDNGLILVDGVKVNLTSGASALVRASNTGAELSTIFEAPAQAELIELMRTVIGFLRPFEATASLDLGALTKQFEALGGKF